ncbi:RDD family protein [Aeoliella sp.]|uniref:RDD family protein n=1 Tax=Aeoliella sp. TaxID=2795800 RepID=UPI003CCBF0E7
MDEQNPFASPLAANDLRVPDAPDMSPLAGRGTRLGAALIDVVILAPLGFAIGAAEAIVLISAGVDPAALQSPGLLLNLVSQVLGFGLFLAVNGYLLATNGQTVGKKLLGIKIVRTDGSRADFSRLTVRRYLPMSLLLLIPVFGIVVAGLVDPLMIFRGSRKCLHDEIADTVVVVDE